MVARRDCVLLIGNERFLKNADPQADHVMQIQQVEIARQEAIARYSSAQAEHERAVQALTLELESKQQEVEVLQASAGSDKDLALTDLKASASKQSVF